LLIGRPAGVLSAQPADDAHDCQDCGRHGDPETTPKDAVVENWPTTPSPRIAGVNGLMLLLSAAVGIEVVTVLVKPDVQVGGEDDWEENHSKREERSPLGSSNDAMKASRMMITVAGAAISRSNSAASASAIMPM